MVVILYDVHLSKPQGIIMIFLPFLIETPHNPPALSSYPQHSQLAYCLSHFGPRLAPVPASMSGHCYRKPSNYLAFLFDRFPLPGTRSTTGLRGQSRSFSRFNPFSLPCRLILFSCPNYRQRSFQLNLLCILPETYILYLSLLTAVFPVFILFFTNKVFFYIHIFIYILIISFNDTKHHRRDKSLIDSRLII